MSQDSAEKTGKMASGSVMVQQGGADQPAFAPVAHGSLVTCEDLFTVPELDAIIRLGDGLGPEPGQPAACLPRNAETEAIHHRIEEAVLAINNRIFRFDLFALSPFRYAVLRTGEQQDWRRDYDRDLGQPAQEACKLSFCLQLSDGSAYDGGALEVRAGNSVDVAPRSRGALVAFPAYAFQRITPVRSGIRRALLLRAVGPEFR
jgi:hypothetical protein